MSNQSFSNISNSAINTGDGGTAIVHRGTRPGRKAASAGQEVPTTAAGAGGEGRAYVSDDQHHFANIHDSDINTDSADSAESTDGSGESRSGAGNATAGTDTAGVEDPPGRGSGRGARGSVADRGFFSFDTISGSAINTAHGGHAFHYAGADQYGEDAAEDERLQDLRSAAERADEDTDSL